MRTFPIILLLAQLVACAGSASPPATATGDAPPTLEATAAFFDALQRNDEDAALAMLARAPGLGTARSPRGTSAYLVALLRVVGVGFVNPQANRVANAILALKPPLDAFECAAAGDRRCVEVELGRDASFVARVHAIGWTPLHFASFAGQPAVAELLLARGAAVDATARNRFGNTPLQVALLTRQGDLAKLLLAHGADVNFKQTEGVTALHEAAQSGDLEIARTLLEAGADPSAKTGRLDDGREGVTAIEMARRAGHEEVAKLLEARAPARATPSSSAP